MRYIYRHIQIVQIAEWLSSRFYTFYITVQLATCTALLEQSHLRFHQTLIAYLYTYIQSACHTALYKSLTNTVVLILLLINKSIATGVSICEALHGLWCWLIMIVILFSGILWWLYTITGLDWTTGLPLNFEFQYCNSTLMLICSLM